jgi:hypothetical protein
MCENSVYELKEQDFLGSLSDVTLPARAGTARRLVTARGNVLRCSFDLTGARLNVELIGARTRAM